uniref:Cornifelin homolog A-like n=1 Tax=Poecilia latipinna TaxID=48699 RepID=A0A3B3VZ31_9TELE
MFLIILLATYRQEEHALIEWQPVMAALKNWKSSLFDCFEDVNTCCYGFWCCPCLACTVSGRFGENYCLPLCDILTPSVCAACGVPLFVPPAALSMRASILAMRHKYGIKGSLCKDIVATSCCPICVWCQMYRELKHRKKSPVVINMEVQSPVNMQPHPMMAAPPQPVFNR